MKLQMQIQRIEDQQKQLKDKMERDKQAEIRRIQRDKRLKAKISEYQTVKHQIEK
jgi:hypothetical protein